MKWHSHLALIVALLSSATIHAHAQGRRPMVVEDLFNILTLGDVRMSPDGASIAVVIQRAWSNPETFRPYVMFGNDHADIWLLSAYGGAARNITRGAREGIGYWNPVWSPDGQRLALLSTAGGDNVRAYVWEKRSGRLQRLSERGVDLFAGTDATGGGAFSPMQWVDERRLLVIVLPEGEQPLGFRQRRQTQRIASEAWKKAARGREPTSSILEGGVPAGPERAAQLLLIDVATNRVQVLAEGGIRHVLLSPTREHVAIITQARPPLPVAGQLRVDRWSAPSRLGVVSLRDGATVRWVEGLFNPVVDFGAHPHRWSPRGSALAALAPARAEPGSPRGVYVVSLADRSVRRAAENLAASAVEWSEGEQLLVRARTPGRGERADWWSVAAAPAESRNLTADLPAVPAQLVRTSRANEMIGLAAGALWAFDLTTGSHRPLVEAAEPSASAIVWPAPEERVTSSLSSMIVRVREGDAESLLRLDLSSPRAVISKFPEPAKGTTLAGYHPGRNLAVFAAPEDPDGSFIWTGTGGNANFARRIALNLQMAGIAGGEPIIIDYRSTDGQALKGLLLLPAGYQRGARYPLVTWVYPEYVIRDIASERNWTTKNRAHMDNLHILAGHGYAVLIPSMPGSRARDEMPAGVLPAVDRAVELGIADSGRVAVAGQSGGGFATYSLITQTNRFKAAVAINGTANNISVYGTFSGEMRYLDDADEIVGGGAGRWGVPPWEDPDRWARNSPITFINRVETPLLIIHGDIDYVPIQQAEEVFSSLTRLGRRVRFVRYWGESHGSADSSANLRDRWQQMFRWLDTYLRDAR